MAWSASRESGTGGPAAVVVLLLASTLGIMAGGTVVPVLQVIRDDLGLGGTAAGFIITAHGLAIAVSSPLTGRLIDRLGVRTVLVGGLVLYGLAGGTGLFATSYPALIAGRLVFGVGAGAVFTGTTAALLALYRGRQRDQIMGWRASFTSLGGVVWPLLAGAVGGISWHAAFAVYLVGIPLGIATVLTLPNTRPEPQSGIGGSVLRLLRMRPALPAVYALMIATALLQYAIAIFLPQRLAEVGVTAPFWVSTFTIGSSVAMSLIGLLYAKLRTRLGHGTLLRAAAALWVATFAILGTASAPAVILIAPLLYGLGNGIAFPTLTVLVGELAPARLRGRAVSLSTTAAFAGQFCSPLVLGPVIAATTTTSGFLIAAGFAAVILAVLCTVRIAVPPADQEDTVPA